MLFNMLLTGLFSYDSLSCLGHLGCAWLRLPNEVLPLTGLSQWKETALEDGLAAACAESCAESQTTKMIMFPWIVYSFVQS